jgi:hypothetical protein
LGCIATKKKLASLTFLLFPFQAPSYYVGIKAGAECYVIFFVRDNCFGLVDIENWNKTFVMEPSCVFVPHCPWG